MSSSSSEDNLSNKLCWHMIHSNLRHKMFQCSTLTEKDHIQRDVTSQRHLAQCFFEVEPMQEHDAQTSTAWCSPHCDHLPHQRRTSRLHSSEDSTSIMQREIRAKRLWLHNSLVADDANPVRFSFPPGQPSGPSCELPRDPNLPGILFESSAHCPDRRHLFLCLLLLCRNLDQLIAYHSPCEMDVLGVCVCAPNGVLPPSRGGIEKMHIRIRHHYVRHMNFSQWMNCCAASNRLMRLRSDVIIWLE